MKKNCSVKKLIVSDCLKAMLPNIIIYTFTDLFCSLLTVYTANILGSFADSVFNMDIEQGMSRFWVLLVSLLITVFIVPAVNMGGEVIMFSNTLHHDRYVMRRFLNKTYSSAMSIEAGEARMHLEDDPNGLRGELVEIIEKLIITPLTFAYLLYNAIKINFFFTLVVFLVSLIKLVMPLVVKNVQAKFHKAAKEYGLKTSIYETEIIQNPHIVKLFGLKRALIQKLNNLYKEYYDRIIKKSTRYNSIVDCITSFISTFCELAILLVGAILVSKGQITPGSVAAMIGYFGIFNSIIDNVGSLIRSYPIVKDEIERMEILYIDEENNTGESVNNMSVIEATDISFSFDDKKIFNNISFSIEKGEKVAIVGANGSGKSTLLKLLCGLLKEYEGSIKINGKELNCISVDKWRDCFTFVTQDPYLFEGNVIENIGIGNSFADEAALDNVMERLGITYLADRDVLFNDKTLSGGEKTTYIHSEGAVKRY